KQRFVVIDTARNFRPLANAFQQAQLLLRFYCFRGVAAKRSGNRVPGDFVQPTHGGDEKIDSGNGPDIDFLNLLQRVQQVLRIDRGVRRGADERGRSRRRRIDLVGQRRGCSRDERPGKREPGSSHSPAHPCPSRTRQGSIWSGHCNVARGQSRTSTPGAADAPVWQASQSVAVRAALRWVESASCSWTACPDGRG